ncbi:MAG: serine/threonine-protein phosphatase [Deltaproteobacteria bacterium]|nr:serine/threonine-protein phosphatase [Deltaproteobacteria bacterium]
MVAPPVTNPPPPLMAHAISHAGHKRSQNEDAFGVFVSDRLFIVADGMGSRSAAEIASHMAVDELSGFFRSFHNDPRQAWPYPVDREKSLGANLLTVGIKVANDKLRIAAEAHRVRTKVATKMACTIVALAVGDNQLSIAHAGDSRAYRFRAGELKQLTVDHSILAEMIAARPDMAEAEIASFSHRNVVTKAVGSKPDIEPMLTIKRFQSGDSYLLCSDGLWGSVKDGEIADILRSTADLEAACQLLVDAANDAGGPDNITALIVRVG